MRDRAQPIGNLLQPYASRRWFCFRFQWRSNVEFWYFRGDGPFTLVSSRNPGLRRGTSRLRCRYDVRRQRVPHCSAKCRSRGFERHRPLPAALGVLRLNIREVYGRRWSVASLPVKAKKSGSGRSFLLDKLVLRFRRGSRRQARRGPSILWRPATPACSALEAGSAELGGIPQGDIFGCTGLIGQDVDTFSGPVLERH